ncbi:DEAD/DEAH box helicase [Dyella telluris]|uniref:DEAD/DEAH box helicase n=1 Tax=Dyella telluris TaxID=2763498 RepID=A0A7G8Q4H3_9GAMM|nr:DEAD/DEAH box helicase [Dyella telluris]QNK01681.1 DEAD/DEAH box helicase [Dyella telluris]
MNVKIAMNAVVAKLITDDRELKLAVSDLLSYNVAGAEHSQSFQTGGWSGRSTLFSYGTSTFPAGLVSMVYTWLKQKGYNPQLIRKPAPEPLGKPEPIVNEFGKSEAYDYQYEAVRQLIRHRAIIAQVATGGGKSNIASIAVGWIKRPTLFLTTRKVLMHQMKRTFQKSLKWRARNGEPEMAGVKVGVMGDSEFNPRKHINVGMVQTIMAKLTSDDPKVVAQMKAILAMFEFVILEEAHESSGGGYYEIMGNCTNAHYRLALTATPFMREDEEANMRLMACSGPIAIHITEKMLIDRGVLARPEFKFITPPQSQKVRRNSDWQRSYNYGIVNNEARNGIIIAESTRAARNSLSVMILVQRQEHGNNLEAQLKEAGVRARFIFGKSEQDERDEALASLMSGELQVLIGSTILDVGVDVPAVGMVILAGGGKAEVALRQRIGRGLRKKPAGMPNVAYIIDFMDAINKHLVGHAAQRRQIIESTPGFAENILPSGRDFSFTYKLK